MLVAYVYRANLCIKTTDLLVLLLYSFCHWSSVTLEFLAREMIKNYSIPFYTGLFFPLIIQLADESKIKQIPEYTLSIFLLCAVCFESCLQYSGSVDENVADVVVMRIKALDKDLDHTDNWLTVFTIAKGNEDNLFSIETDKKTNEGILKLIKVFRFVGCGVINCYLESS